MPASFRRVSALLLTVLAAALIVAALVVPEAIARGDEGAFIPGAFLRLPIELILFGAVVFALPVRWRRPFAVLFGLGMGMLVILKAAHIGYRSVLGHKFNPVVDLPLLGDGYNAVAETDGRTTANLYVAGAVIGTIGVFAVLVAASVRLSRVFEGRTLPTRRTLVGLSAVWIALALSGVTLFPDTPVASDSGLTLLKSTARKVPATIRDERQFAAAVIHDPYASVPRADLVSGLRGKDVIVGVVESYGRASLTEPGMSAIVGPALDAAQARLRAAGFHARTGWLTSSTFGGGSWLAHASFQSGLWITSQRRYDGMVSGDRLTLTRAFKEAGWQTAGIEPGNTRDWPEADFYGYDRVLDSRNMGYRGPKFGWSRIPDQYVLKTFQEQVYATRTKPLMAEISLTSSHAPWTHVPSMIPWNTIGDGKIYGPQAASAPSRSKLWSDRVKTRSAYARTIAYSVESLTTWAADHAGENTVLIMFGDHQPMARVSGPRAGYDVPISVIAQDPAVLDRIAAWNWTDGLKPADAPVWRMDEFRNKFFAAYGRPGLNLSAARNR